MFRSSSRATWGSRSCTAVCTSSRRAVVLYRPLPTPYPTHASSPFPSPLLVTVNYLTALACPRLPYLSLLFPNRPTPDPCLPLVLRIPPFTRRPRRARTDLFPFLLPHPSIHPSIYLPFPSPCYPTTQNPSTPHLPPGTVVAACGHLASRASPSIRPPSVPLLLHSTTHTHRRHPPPCWGTAVGSR